MPSLALSCESRLCRLEKLLARYNEGNLSSSVIRLGKCQGADAQEQRCCSSQIPNHKSLPPCYFLRSPPSCPTRPSASAATRSKNRRLRQLVPVNQERRSALAARGAADRLPASRRCRSDRVSNFKKCPSTQPDSQVKPHSKL